MTIQILPCVETEFDSYDKGEKLSCPTGNGKITTPQACGQDRGEHRRNQPIPEHAGSPEEPLNRAQERKKKIISFRDCGQPRPHLLSNDAVLSPFGPSSGRKKKKKSVGIAIVSSLFQESVVVGLSGSKPLFVANDITNISEWMTRTDARYCTRWCTGMASTA